MDITFQLMSKHSWFVSIVVLWSVGLLLLVDNVSCQELPYQFNLPFYQKSNSWLSCPRGWRKINGLCLLYVTQAASFSQADNICDSYGGTLIQISDYVSNNKYGRFVEEHSSNITAVVDTSDSSLERKYVLSYWIGLYRDEEGQYKWSNGEIAQEFKGFWTLNQPLGFQQGFKQCGSVGIVGESNYGRYRWKLRECEDSLPFMCQISPCIGAQVRCNDGQKCISSDWLCDGNADCADKSDEINCHGSCGGSFQGLNGTFQSPNYTHSSYPMYSSCQWKIQTPIGTRVKLKFESFDLEYLYDNVRVYDGSSVKDPLAGVYTGNKTEIVPLSTTNFLLVTFESDQDNQHSGFNISWQAVTVTGCGGKLMSDSHTQWFSSSDFPALYPANLVCDWVIQAQSQGQLVSLQFLNFSLVGTSDWIEVRDGDSEDSQLFGRFTGDSLPPVLISSRSSLFVRFLTNDHDGSTGFNATYKSGCDILIWRGDMRFSSPGFDVNFYPPNTNCTWTIINPDKQELSLIFDVFDTETDFDVVTVQNTTQSVGPVAKVLEFSGTTRPSTTKSALGEFVIHFNSDDQVSRPGWSASVSFKCPELLPLPKYTYINSSLNEYGSVVRFDCDTGYSLSGANLIICDIGGQWSSQPPTCNIFNCGSPAIPVNGGLIELNSTIYNGRAVYTCNTGYLMVGNDTVRCTQNGWGNVPTCQRIRCPKLVPPEFGNLQPPRDNVFGEIVSYSCYKHYRLVGSSQAYCSANGSWSHPPPHCKPMLCPEISIFNGYTNVSNPISGGDYVHIICNHGYQIEGDEIINCNMNGTYTSVFPVCKDVDECQEGINPCGIHTCQNLLGGYRCKCTEGYRLKPGSDTDCQNINECDTERPCEHTCVDTAGSYNCICNSSYTLYTGTNITVVNQKLLIPYHSCIVTCLGYPVTNGGTIYTNTAPLADGSYIYQTSLYIACPSGKQAAGPNTVYCQHNGQWSAIVSCQDKQCIDLIAPENGQVTYSDSSLSPGTIATYSCKPGYRFVGIIQSQCEEKIHSHIGNSYYTWSTLNLNATCQPLNCGNLSSPVNGQVIFNSTRFGSFAEYFCICGYQIVGSKVRVCQADGMWDGKNAICSPLACQSPDLSGTVGQIIENPPYYVGSEVTFTCPAPGYTLKGATSSRCVANTAANTKSPTQYILLEAEFRGDNTMNANCIRRYGQELAQKFNSTMPTMDCASDLIIDVVDSSTGNFTGTNVHLRVSVAIYTQTNFISSTVCNCTDKIVSRIPTQINWSLSQGDADGCQPVHGKTRSITKISQIWTCPISYYLQTEGQMCAETRGPLCVEQLDCIPDPTQTTEDSIETTSIPVTSSTTLLTTKVITPTFTTSTTLPTTNTSTTSSTTTLQEPTTEKQSTTVTSTSTIPQPETTSQPSMTTETTTIGTTATPSSTTVLTSQPLTTDTSRTTTTTVEMTTQPNANFPYYKQEWQIGYPMTVAACESGYNDSIRNATTQISSEVKREMSNNRKLCGGITFQFESQVSDKNGSLLVWLIFKYTKDNSIQAESCAEALYPTIEQKLPSVFPAPCGNHPVNHRVINRFPSLWQCDSNYDLDINQHLCILSTSKSTHLSSLPATADSTDDHVISSLLTTTTSTAATNTFTTTAESTTTKATTQVPSSTGATVTSRPIEKPFYWIEIKIKFEGNLSSTNVCTEALKMNIERVVQSTSDVIQSNLQIWPHCSQVTDAIMLKTNGHITINDEQMLLIVPFALKTGIHSMSLMQNCAVDDVVSYLNSNFSRKLRDLLANEDIINVCTLLNMTNFQVVNTDWRCRSNYVVDRNSGTCVYFPYMPIQEVKLALVLSSSDHNPSNDAQCLTDYKNQINNMLSGQEPIVNMAPTLISNCRNQYVYIDMTSPTSNVINVTSDNNYQMTITVTYHAMSETVINMTQLICLALSVTNWSNSTNILGTDKVITTIPNHCSNLTVNQVLFLMKKEACVAGYTFIPEYYRCLQDTSTKYVLSTKIEYTLNTTASQYCLLRLREELKINLDIYVESSMAMRSSFCADIFLKVEVLLDKYLEFKVKAEVSFVLQSFKGNNSGLQICGRKVSEDLRDIQLLQDNVPASVQGDCNANIYLSDFTLEGSYFQCSSDEIWDENSLSCILDNGRRKRRKKRDIATTTKQTYVANTTTSLSLIWTEDKPMCQDKQAPVLHCPTETVIVEVGQRGPLPVNVILPTATDNSGVPPTVTFIPNDFHKQPYLFRKNMTVAAIAIDKSGMKSTPCYLYVFLIDTTSPTITCPSEVYIQQYDDQTNEVQLSYHGNIVNASDYSGIFNITYYPPGGEHVKFREQITVTAVAQDNAGNQASCFFTYEAMRGNISPNSKIKMLFNFMYEEKLGNESDCIQNYTDLLQRIITNISIENCNKNGSKSFDFFYEGSMAFQTAYQGIIDLNMTIFDLDLDLDMRNLTECFACIVNHIHTHMQPVFTLPLLASCHQCNVTLKLITQAYECPVDSVLNKNQCVQCPKGYHANQSQAICERCPIPMVGSTAPSDCRLCTSDVETSNCLKYCPPGQFSENGLQPCIKCPQGTFTDTIGSITCVWCPDFKSTISDGSTNSSDCKDYCMAGSYSDTGLEPCKPCPENFYSDTNMSTFCTECPVGQISGQQSSSSSNCTRYDFCGNDACKNGGTCTSVSDGRWYICICPDGYYGDSCQNNVNECESSVCLNGGICQGDINNFTCICPTGFTGRRCEFPPDRCLSNPCYNGQCVNNAANFTCYCYNGFTGQRCETDIDDCVNHTCQHGGICYDLINDYQCNCTGTGYEGLRCEIQVQDLPVQACFNDGIYQESIHKCSCFEGFTGSQCETNINDCMYNICGQNAICVDRRNNYTCVCKPGFTGRNCNVDLDDCETRPCQNSGTCHDSEGDFWCRCPIGFTGKICEINIDDCQLNRCHVNNTINCIDLLDDYTCICSPGWTGQFCDVPVQECISSPCQHNGTCIDQVNSYLCVCPTGYTGRNCSSDIDDCVSAPCYNGGTCVDMINKFKCECAEGFSGSRCEINIDDCATAQCLNGGTCLDMIGGVTCSCVYGWTGLQCENQIDFCLSQPCQSDSTCQLVPGGFTCLCKSGFTGTRCDTDIDECNSSPCKHGGTCTNVPRGFNCTCLEGYAGETCSELKVSCGKGFKCQNGAVCVAGKCDCRPGYTGIDCGKKKTQNFDLLFHGHQGSMSTTPTIEVKGTDKLSLCLWVRYVQPGGQGTFLTLGYILNNTVSQRKEILELSNRGVKMSYFGDFSEQVDVNDGNWHYLCYTWSSLPSGQWVIYLNGTVIKTGSNFGLGRKMPTRQFVQLGQSLYNGTEIPGFVGELSRVNIFNYTLDANIILQMAGTCNSEVLAGNRHSWSEFEDYIIYDTDVKIIRPSICGGRQCPQGYKGYFCNITIDKEPPLVENCSTDFYVVSKERLTVVNWTQPSFVDNTRIVNIYQSYRPGQIFTYGKYEVNYIAFDEDNNTAVCTFNVYVIPSHCDEPPDPVNGFKFCRPWSDGIYCKISCQDPELYSFSEPIPKFYRCGLEGFWDPPRGKKFTFPNCAAVSIPAGTVRGSMSFTGPTCSDTYKSKLQTDFLQVIEKWNNIYSLCLKDDCNFVISIECRDMPQGRRRRRDAAETAYLVLFDFPINGTMSPSDDLPLSSLKTLVKRGNFSIDGFQADKNSLVVTAGFSCEDGQVLLSDEIKNTCVNCPKGTYLSNITHKCEPCDIGYYNDLDRQMQCKICPDGMTTQDTGAINLSQCYRVCEKGYFLDETSGNCEKCYHGYYQDEIGRKSCKTCPFGQTTETDGAVSSSQCLDACRKGTELNVAGFCVPCQKGTYKSDISQEACLICPYGFTTENVGATSVSECSIVQCPRGYYKQESDNKCHSCPFGQYQPYVGQSACIECGRGLTTRHQGSTDFSHCIAGNVNECATGVANCHPNALCIDTEIFYECQCKSDFYGNGTYCTPKGACGDGICPDSPKSSSTLIGLVAGVSSAAAVIGFIAIVIGLMKFRRKRVKKDKDYQPIDVELHRKKEVVTYPSTLPVVYNKGFDKSGSDISDPTQMSSDFGAHNMSEEEGSWLNGASSSGGQDQFHSENESETTLNGAFDFSPDSYF